MKVGGKRAYALARDGVAAELQPKKVTIHSIELTRWEEPLVELRIECGTGTYVRSLGRDIAKYLGTGCVMEALTRTRIGRFRSSDSATTSTLEEDFAQQLTPMIGAVDKLPLLCIGDSEAADLRNGRFLSRPLSDAVAVDDSNSSGEFAAVLGPPTGPPSSDLVAILRWDGRQFRPVRVF